MLSDRFHSHHSFIASLSVELNTKLVIVGMMLLSMKTSPLLLWHWILWQIANATEYTLKIGKAITRFWDVDLTQPPVGHQVTMELFWSTWANCDFHQKMVNRHGDWKFLAYFSEPESEPSQSYACLWGGWWLLLVPWLTEVVSPNLANRTRSNHQPPRKYVTELGRERDVLMW